MDNFNLSSPEPEEEKVPLRVEIYDWLQCLVMALVGCIIVFLFLCRVIGVDGNSMNPTLLNNDKILISNLFYEPRIGDIVVLTKRTFSSEPIVKRIIATEGQTIDIDFETGEVWRDGKLLDEPYINELTHKYYDVSFPATVPEGCIFVMGDNRNRSTDSRASSIGFVDKRCVLGRVLCEILPLSRFGLVK